MAGSPISGSPSGATLTGSATPLDGRGAEGGAQPPIDRTAPGLHVAATASAVRSGRIEPDSRETDLLGVLVALLSGLGRDERKRLRRLERLVEEAIRPKAPRECLALLVGVIGEHDLGHAGHEIVLLQ